VIYRYDVLKSMEIEELELVVPRVVIFAGKAASAYYTAKLIIKLINAVAEVINHDKKISSYLTVLFLPDYNVSQAELLVPASDISQHISTAGTEASGTSNMKFVLNGGIILGTVDGANIEIAEEIGEENIVLFGLKADEISAARHQLRYGKVKQNTEFERVLEIIRAGAFGDPAIFHALLDSVSPQNDFYLVSQDFGAYLDAQAKVDSMFLDREAWVKKSIICTARMGKFSSDRSVHEYAKKVWHCKPCPIGVVMDDNNGNDKNGGVNAATKN